MADISRTSLFGKLNSLAYKAIESATTFCKLRGNPYVELAHWVHQILQIDGSDLHLIIRHFDIEPSRLAVDLTSSLDGLPRGATSISDFSPHLEAAIERGWLYSTLMFGETKIRTGHLVLGLLKTPTLKNSLHSLSPEFDKVKSDDLADSFAEILSQSREASLAAEDGSDVASAGSVDQIPPPAMGKLEALKTYAVDLTAKAREGEIDPILGRDPEIRQIIDILMRRRQNNPILTGEAGVGKTAVVEGFALRIAQGDVPPKLQDVSLHALDIGLLQAGAGVKGEFENRLRTVVDEVQSSSKPIILFVDEAHTLIGAGGAAGTGDAANLLKPALARGTLRTIAATTWAEYKKYFEKDPALTRRFQVVQIAEPSEESATLMVRGIADAMSDFHKIHIRDEAVLAAVNLSSRYIPSRQLPEKAISLLDTACARVAVSQHATPALVEDAKRRISALDLELEITGRERAVGIDTGKRTADIEESLASEQREFDKLQARWESEKDIVNKYLSARTQLLTNDDAITEAEDGEGNATSPDNASGDKADEPENGLAEIQKLIGQLKELQGEHPLVFPEVDEQAVAAVVSNWTGIPVGRMVKNEIENVLNLADMLGSRVIGQQHALEAIARRVQTSRAKLDNPNKPIGVFLLCGPSGVGKTETALALGEILYGGEHNVITINMSEFQEAHTVSTLKGAPPGYVGYGEGGVLTEAVRRRPYSVVLLDEVEKAHSDVHEIFFQVFDKGVMEDGEGRLIDFKNTLILLTSNVGSDLIINLCQDPELLPDAEGLTQTLRSPLLQTFPAALLGRLIVIPYYPLSDDMVRNIIRLQLGRIEIRIAETHSVAFNYSDDVVSLIASRCLEHESGGRMIDAILTNTMLPEISSEFLRRTISSESMSSIFVGVDGVDFDYRYS